VTTPSHEMREILLSILSACYSTPDVAATQQLGVQLSNAVKRDGVVIIQNQSVEVYSRIIPPLVDALRLCDKLSFPIIQIDPQPPLQIEAQAPEPTSDILDRACRWLYENAYRWEAAQDAFKDHYLGYVVGRFKTKAEAAEFLGIGPTYLSKMTRRED